MSDQPAGEGAAPGVAAVLAAARRDFEEVAGRRVEAVSSASRDEGGWRFGFEVVELSRVPDSTSLLGSYEVLVDYEGNLREYDRLRRYYRNRADEEL